VRVAAPLAAGPLLFGLSLGVLAVDAGMSTVAAVVFFGHHVRGLGAVRRRLGVGNGWFRFGRGLLLNARYVPLSISVASLFPAPVWRRLVESQLIVDESWALSGRSGRFERHILIGAGLLIYVLWVGSTAAGTLIGDRLGDPTDYGLDAAFAVLFLGLALPYLRARRAREAAGVAALIALVLLPFAPSGVPIVVASAACLLGLRR
jgi:predicted branched-subunit amino acid permease